MAVNHVSCHPGHLQRWGQVETASRGGRAESPRMLIPLAQINPRTWHPSPRRGLPRQLWSRYPVSPTFRTRDGCPLPMGDALLVLPLF